MTATNGEKIFVRQGFAKMIVLALDPPDLSLEED